MTQSKKNKIIIGGLLAVVLLMVVGYAAFQTSLKINGTTNVTANWNVKITGISTDKKSEGASNISEPTYDNSNGLSATFNTSFAEPGDYATYKIEITNSGNINAKLTDIIEPTSSNPDISFYVNKDETNTAKAGALTPNSALNKAGETGNVGYVYVTVLYRNYNNQQSPSDSNRKAKATIQFNFEQTDQNGNIVPSEPSLTTVYAYHTDEKTIGRDKLNESEYVTDYTQLNSYKSGKKYFFKYVIDEEGIIQNAYACQKFSYINNPVCFQGGDNEYYDANTTILEDLKPTFESNSGSCSWEFSNIYCDDDDLRVYAGSDGSVYASDSSGRCECNRYGYTICN